MGNWIRDEPSRVGWSLLAHEMGERRAQIDARRTSPPARPPLPASPFALLPPLAGCVAGPDEPGIWLELWKKCMLWT
jgi:hypothetical protein